jgi:hypothetical protein
MLQEEVVRPSSSFPEAKLNAVLLLKLQSSTEEVSLNRQSENWSERLNGV